VFPAGAFFFLNWPDGYISHAPPVR
jgi:hypothetical protein